MPGAPASEGLGGIDGSLEPTLLDAIAAVLELTLLELTLLELTAAPLVLATAELGAINPVLDCATDAVMWGRPLGVGGDALVAVGPLWPLWISRSELDGLEPSQPLTITSKMNPVEQRIPRCMREQCKTITCNGVRRFDRVIIAAHFSLSRNGSGICTSARFETWVFHWQRKVQTFPRSEHDPLQ